MGGGNNFNFVCMFIFECYSSLVHGSRANDICFAFGECEPFFIERIVTYNSSFYCSPVENFRHQTCNMLRMLSPCIIP